MRILDSLERLYQSLLTIILFEDDEHEEEDDGEFTPDTDTDTDVDTDTGRVFDVHVMNCEPLPGFKRDLQSRHPEYLYYSDDDPTEEEYRNALEFVQYYDEKTFDDERYSSFFIQSLHDYIIRCSPLSNKQFRKIKREFDEKYKLAKRVCPEELRLHDMRRMF